MSEYMIEIQNLSRFYGPIEALNGINLNIRRGEVTGFLGPNGAGKTTAMRILSGLLTPTTGNVLIDGINMLDDPVAAKYKIGFLPETPPIYNEMTVAEYLIYLSRLRRPKESAKERAHHAMERCGLLDVKNRLLRNLSKGYRQRAGIAQAIVHNPEIVILDEPTVGLDPIQIREIRTLIRELGGEHSVLLSTHILPEVQMTCDRVAVINQGKIVTQSTLEDLEKSATTKRRIHVCWNKPPERKRIQVIEGVARAQQEGNMWVITPQKEANPIDALVRQSVENDWQLQEIRTEKDSLEDIFVHLTTQESDEEATASQGEQS
ncbi:ABC transporter ATP-binding protein [Magnetococcales bacterium HHB-1]